MELYIHIPFCARKCLYCDFLSFDNMDKEENRYVAALTAEIRNYGRLLKDQGKSVTTIFIGGGTPSRLDVSNLSAIMDAVHQSFEVIPNAEVTIEANPGTINEAKAKQYLALGINRISVGLQSANNDELELLGRIHTWEQFLLSYESIRRAGFHDVNIDIMTGLPYQTQDKLQNTLTQVMRLQPEHISAYSLIIEKGTPFYQKYMFDTVKQHAGMPTEALPSEDDEYRLGKLAQTTLENAGWQRYEISNYAKPGCECIHNTGYWTREEYLGVGLGASSLMDETRFSNIRDFYKYIEAIEAGNFGTIRTDLQPLSKKNQMEEFMYLGLRMTAGVSIWDFQNTFDTSLIATYGDVLRELEAQQLLVQAEGRVFLTDKGLDLSNYCMSKFIF